MPLKPSKYISEICYGYYYNEFHSIKSLGHLPVVERYVENIFTQLGDLSFYERLTDAEILRHLADGEIVLLRRKYD